uniref:ORF5 protein n=1 Tax=Spodoptera exigua virus AKJ-2014 TaxID=1453322 RepID=A0A023NGG2_9PICO|nr:ORF5 protein [Spodoptera exigua virus AKJ-2014]
MTDTSGEIQAEGVSNLTVTAPANTDTVPLVPELNKPAPASKKPDSHAGKTKKNQIGALNQRFQHFNKFTVGGTPTLTWTNINIDPYNITGKGEAFNLPFRRNVWTSGSMSMGYLTSLQVQVHVARPPQVSGTIQFRDGNNPLATAYNVDFGGRIDFPLVPNVMNIPIRPRHYNSPWFRTDEAACTLSYRLIAFNRTADIADVTVDVYIRPGASVFNTPIKPKPRAVSALSGFAQAYHDYEEAEYVKVYGGVAEIEHHGMPEEFSDRGRKLHFDNWCAENQDIHQGDEDLAEAEFTPIWDKMCDELDGSDDHVAPPAVDSPEEGMINYIEHQDDDIDQDDYTIRVWEGELTIGQPLAIPLNLSVLRDVSTISDETTIGQKFERFAHIMPATGGNLGPEIGTYTIHTRLPTNVAASIAHVCVPDDLTDEVAARIFGLAKVLDIAGSAIGSIGGPLIAGAVQTAPKLIKTVLPGPLGSLASKVVGGVANGLLGGKPPAPQDPPGESSTPAAIGGKIPIARFLEFLKPVATNLVADPSFSNLLVELIDSFGDLAARATPTIPISVYVRMTGATDRSVFNRSVVPRDNVANLTWVPRDRVSYLFDMFGNNPNTFVEGTHQNRCFKQLMTVVRQRTNVPSINMQEVLATEVPEDLSRQIQSLLLARNSTGLMQILMTAREEAPALGPN